MLSRAGVPRKHAERELNLNMWCGEHAGEGRESGAGSGVGSPQAEGRLDQVPVLIGSSGGSSGAKTTLGRSPAGAEDGWSLVLALLPAVAARGHQEKSGEEVTAAGATRGGE